jgi:outer membrane lipoprotein-sorting protein
MFALVMLPSCMTAMAGEFPPGLEEIVAAQSGATSLEGRFRQTKTLSLFDETITSSGTIIIEKPDFYCWIYDEPERRVFYVDGTRTGSVDAGAGANHSTALDDTALADVIQSVSGLVSGNLRESALQDYAIVSTPSSDDALRYTFVPRSEAAMELFEQVTISFDPATGLARELEIVEHNGDTSVMAFEDWQENIAVNRSALVQ